MLSFLSTLFSRLISALRSIRSTSDTQGTQSSPSAPRPGSSDSPRSTSEKGLSLIKRFEGLRLAAYLDSVGVPTIGYGHTKGVKMGDRITADHADAFLREDVRDAERAVNRLVSVPLSQGQFDALVSFTFNLGAGNLGSSTLLRKLNAHDYKGTESEFGRWIHAGGKRLDGLALRREAERRMFAGH